MSGKLRLGPLPKTEVVRLTIALPVAVKADLDRYAELYGTAYGDQVDAAALAPHMLAAFMERDREFRRARQGISLAGDTPSRSTNAAISRTSANDAESSTSE